MLGVETVGISGAIGHAGSLRADVVVGKVRAVSIISAGLAHATGKIADRIVVVRAVLIRITKTNALIMLARGSR